MRILVAEPIAAEGIALLRASHEVDERPGLARDELCAILPGYDALIVRSQVQVDAEMIAAGTRLVVIGRAGVGVDNVDLDAATRAGIVVVNAPTGNTIAAVEHTLALLYGLARRTAGHRGPGQDRPGHRGAGSGDGDDGARRGPVRDRRAGGEPRSGAGRIR
jgi:D-3-phosphoglycerate dehydrogenase